MKNLIMAIVLLPLAGCHQSLSPEEARVAEFHRLNANVKHAIELRDNLTKTWMADCTKQSKVLGMDPFNEPACVEVKAGPAPGTPADPKPAATAEAKQPVAAKGAQ